MEGILKKVTLEDFELYYEVYGEGNTVIICFHGNDGDANNFQFLAKEDRKIISIHLFLHHYSTFSPARIDPGNVPLKAVEKLFENILKNENIDLFHWVAYSQGGRFTLSLFPQFSKQVKSLYLIAPDGLNPHSFYSWSQRQWLLRKLFKYATHHPKKFMKIPAFLGKIKLIHPKVVEFLEHYGEHPDKLYLGYASWSSFRNLKPNPKRIQKAFEEHTIRFQLIVGEHDHIIQPKSAEKFTQQIAQPNALTLIPCGHNIFKPEVESLLLELLDFVE